MDGCIFRDLRTRCTLCSKETVNESLFCQKHYNTKNPVFHVIMEVYKDKQFELDSTTIMSVYKEVYQRESSKMTRESILKSLLGKKSRIIPITESFGLRTSKKTLKKDLFSTVFNRLEWFSMVSSLRSTNRKVAMAQGLWKDYMRKISGSIYGSPCNEEDIFTFHALSEIANPFYILDNEHCYVFEPAYLYEFFKREGYWNPYTRNAIARKEFVRLNKFLCIKNIKKEIFQKYQWDTVEKAYTDVVIELDRLGFLTQVEWFVPLRFNVIMRIINKFHQYTMDISNSHFMDDGIDNVYPQYIYTFCKMALELLRDKHNPDHYTLVCLFYRSLIESNSKFRDSAPEWMLEINLTFLFP